MSGYGSMREVREVTESTLRMEGRDPAEYNLAGIMRDAFYSRGAGYGYGAAPEDDWRAAVARHSKASVDAIERRDFTWCSAFYPERLAHEHFVVMTPDRGAAQDRAELYAAERWGKAAQVSVYPRTYVVKARAAYAAGLHD